MNVADRIEVERMIEKSREKSWGHFIATFLTLLFVVTIFLQPLVTKVVIPYWYELTGWAWLAEKVAK